MSEVNYLATKNIKIHVIGIVSVVGLIISLIMGLVVFGPSFGVEIPWITINQDYAIVILSVGITMTIIGVSALQRSGTKLTKKAIADFANPILETNGKVSALEIAKNPLKNKIEVDILIKTYLNPMISEGYFEKTHIENGWLVKEVTQCRYCKTPVKTTDAKCPNCGASVKNSL